MKCMDKFRSKTGVAISALTLSVAMAGITSMANAQDTDAIIERSFFPNKQGALPLPPGVTLKEGDIINQQNVDQYKELLDPSSFDLLKEGKGAPIKVGPLNLELEMHPKYVEASRKNIGKVQIVNGNLRGYESGRPFPEAPYDIEDPVEAGQKLAWNYRHTYAAGEQVAVQHPWIWKYNSMRTGERERELHLQVNFKNFKYRTVHEPIPEILPNPNNIFRALYVKAFRPQDVADTQVLLHLFEDDTQRAAGWVYLGFQKRVRNIDTGQLEDSFLGSDLMLRDFEGYFGPLGEMEWKYHGTKTLLMPVFYHNDQDLSQEYTNWSDGYRYIKMGGAGECFLDVTWSPRRVHLLESTPKDPSNPVSRRMHYVDSQSYVMPINLIYDRSGNLWKNFAIPHSSSEHDLPRNKGEYGASYKGFTIIDLQTQRCTTGQKRTEIGGDVSPPHMFTPQFMREGGARQ